MSSADEIRRQRLREQIEAERYRKEGIPVRESVSDDADRITTDIQNALKNPPQKPPKGSDE